MRKDKLSFSEKALTNLVLDLILNFLKLLSFIGFTFISVLKSVFSLIFDFKNKFTFLLKGLLKKLKTQLKASFKTATRKIKKLKRVSKRVKKPKKIPKASEEKKISKKNIKEKIKYFVAGVVFTISLNFVISSYVFLKNLPNPKLLKYASGFYSTHIYDRYGRLLYEIYRQENRTPVKLEDLPDYVKWATIAIEDKDFYKHKGVAPIGGILRAIKDTILTGKLQGGSTITQQLVKNTLLTPKRTIQRKIKEIILALWTEKMYSKDEILQMYLNQIPYGGAAYGIQEAARLYFGKDAKDLTLPEAALLAGLPQAPSYYSPYLNPQAALARRNEVLKKMYELSYISKSQYEKAKNTPLNVKPPKTPIKAPHFVFYVEKILEERYGSQTVEEGGLRVYTTLDLDLQQKAEKIVKEEIDKIRKLNVTNAAVLVTRPPTGEILAMVGSYDYFASPSGAFNVTTALRQPGSSIKPILYSLALKKGFTAATILDDSPVVFNIPGSKPYKPVNYDGKFHGKIPLRYAFANSYNVPAVKVLNKIGVKEFVKHAKKMGITTWDEKKPYGLAIALGAAEVKMTDLSVAYGVLANLGYKVDLNPILRIETVDGKTIYQRKTAKKRVLSPEIAYIISDILSDNFARSWAFGLHSQLNIPGFKVAVKTGTSNEKRDNWTVGYTPYYLVAVWVGNNDFSPMNQKLTSGITGAAPIWRRVMLEILQNYQKRNVWFKKPKNIIEIPCYFGRKELFIKGTEKGQCKPIKKPLTPTPSP